MTTPRNRRPARPQRQITRTAPRPGWGNQNARRSPDQLVVYRAAQLLTRLLAQGPRPRTDVLAYLRRRGVGVNSAHAAAALLGVPSNSHCGRRRCNWTLPPQVPPLADVLAELTEFGRDVAKDARYERGLLARQGRGVKELAKNANA